MTRGSFFGQRAKDIQRCLKNIHSFSDGQASILDWDSDELTNITIQLAPKCGLFEGGRFDFWIKFPERYPEKGPEIYCLTNIYHPNINMDIAKGDRTGNVCFSLLDEWNSARNGLEDIVNGLLFLLNYPNLRDPWASFIDTSMSRRVLKRKVRQSLAGMNVKDCHLVFTKFIEYDTSLDKYHSDLESDYEDEGEDDEDEDEIEARDQAYFFNGGEERSNRRDEEKEREKKGGEGENQNEAGTSGGGENEATKEEETEQMDTDGATNETSANAEEKNENEGTVENEAQASGNSTHNNPADGGGNVQEEPQRDQGPTEEANSTESAANSESATDAAMEVDHADKNVEDPKARPLDIESMLAKVESIIDTLKPEDYLDEHGDKPHLYEGDDCGNGLPAESNSNGETDENGQTIDQDAAQNGDAANGPQDNEAAEQTAEAPLKPSLSRQDTKKLEDILSSSQIAGSSGLNPTRSGQKRCMSLDVMLRTSPRRCISSFLALSRQETLLCSKLPRALTHKRLRSSKTSVSAEPAFKVRKLTHSAANSKESPSCAGSQAAVSQQMLSGCFRYWAMLESQLDKSHIDVSSIVERYKKANIL